MLIRRTIWLSLLAVVFLRPDGAAQAQQPSQLQPHAPFKLAGNIYFVGTNEIADFLVTTPQGHILINTDYEQNVPRVRANVEKLGFEFGDIKIILLSHAHVDHDGGAAAVKAQTGATYMVMDADVGVVESGGKTDFYYNVPPNLYTPTKVDRVLHDGDKVTLGGTVLVARLTPGHTKGCTTWTTQVQEAGKTYNVAIVGGAAMVPRLKLINNPAYPDVVADFERTFQVLKSLPVDIFLGPHESYFNMDAKYAQLLQHGATNPFVDPEGYAKFVAKSEAAFRAELAKQQAAQRAAG